MRKLLEFADDMIEQLAAAVGYEDTRGLRRAFKRVVGLSPIDCRRRFRRMPR